MLANRVRKNFRRLHPRFEEREIGAFRVYDRDIPEIRAAIDWYEGHLVVAEYAREQTAHVPWLETMARAVADALDVPWERAHLKKRVSGKRAKWAHAGREHAHSGGWAGGNQCAGRSGYAIAGKFARAFSPLNDARGN